MNMRHDSWPPPPHSNKPTRFDWHGFFFAALLAIACGMLLAWGYGIIRLLQVY